MTAGTGAGTGLLETIARIRTEVCALHAELTRYELVVWTAGNVSARVPGTDLMVIKPSGVAYQDLTPEQMIVTDLYGTPVRGTHVGGGGTVDWLEPRAGAALGLGAREWPVEHYELPRGHGLLLLTDGLFEGHSGRGDERLGEEGLLTMARSLARLPGADFVEALIEHAEARAHQHGGLTDDIAVIRVERS